VKVVVKKLKPKSAKRFVADVLRWYCRVSFAYMPPASATLKRDVERFIKANPEIKLP
jgi:hypothetical protein